MLVINFSLGMPIIALADTYDKFMKTQVAEFQSVGDELCKVQKREVIKDSQKITYELCILRGKPIFLYVYTDGAALDISNYRNGKLVQMALSEFGDGVGFRNGQPVVEWRSGEYGNRGVNWKITAKDKAIYLESAAKQRRILLKLFGVR